LDELDRYRTGKLSPEEDASVKNHVVLCDYCSDLLLSLDQFNGSSDADSQIPESEIDQAYRDLIQAELVSRIHREIPPDLKHRYSVLCKKRDSGSLSSDEREELVRLVDQLEHLQAARVEALADLVEIRGIPLEQLLKELDLKPLLDDTPDR
jgi:hypothetical protein